MSRLRRLGRVATVAGLATLVVLTSSTGPDLATTRLEPIAVAGSWAAAGRSPESVEARRSAMPTADARATPRDGASPELRATRKPERSSTPAPTEVPAAASPTSPNVAPTVAPVASAPAGGVAGVSPPGGVAEGAFGTLYVSPAGSDSNPGTADRPFRTVEHALSQVGAGQILYLAGGTYVEDVEADLSAGSADRRILVSAVPGQRPVIKGLVSIRNPRYVTFNGFNVTWNTGAYDEHMFKITGGEGWVLQNSEIWGARSFANLLITGSPRHWAVRGNVIHDTFGGESDINRSHNVYANTGLDAVGGVIERNLLFNATHGTNLKLAGPGGSDSGAANVVVRYNTLHNATQPLLIGDGSHSLIIERNIIGGSARGNLVRLYQLTGGGITVRDNLGWAGSSWCDDYDSTVKCAQVNGANRFPHDPQFAAGGFRPGDPVASQYGRFAP